MIQHTNGAGGRLAGSAICGMEAQTLTQWWLSCSMVVAGMPEQMPVCRASPATKNVNLGIILATRSSYGGKSLQVSSHIPRDLERWFSLFIFSVKE